VFGDDPLGQDAEVMHRHHVPLRGPAAGIAQGRLVHPQLPRTFGRDPSEPGLGSVGAQRLTQDDRGIVARHHDHAADQLVDGGAVGRCEKHRRAAEAHRAFADRKARVECQATVIQRLERHQQGHELRHGRWRQWHVGILRQQHLAGVVVDHPGRPRFGLECGRGPGETRHGKRRRETCRDGAVPDCVLPGLHSGLPGS
jgi:hypothetical protein